MLLNFWNLKEFIYDFEELYHLSPKQMATILSQISSDHNCDYIKAFCESCSLGLDQIDVANDIELLGKIVSTTIDNCEHIKKMGILPIDSLLESDSPIHSHLKKYNIEIFPSSKELYYKGKKWCIPTRDEGCKLCMYDDKQCECDINYREYRCPYFKAIDRLATKLYSDRSEIEMFLAGSEESMLEYSTVKNYPEIFYTIETFISKWTGDSLNIGSSWARAKNYTCIVTVPIKYADLSYKNDFVDGNNEGDAFSLLRAYGDFCVNTYYELEQVPKCFWDNIWIISKCLQLIQSSCESINYICAGIKHDVTISPEKISIKQV